MYQYQSWLLVPRRSICKRREGLCPTDQPEPDIQGRPLLRQATMHQAYNVWIMAGRSESGLVIAIISESCYAKGVLEYVRVGWRRARLVGLQHCSQSVLRQSGSSLDQATAHREPSLYDAVCGLAVNAESRSRSASFAGSCYSLGRSGALVTCPARRAWGVSVAVCVMGLLTLMTQRLR